jgi:hypothetical protein
MYLNLYPAFGGIEITSALMPNTWIINLEGRDGGTEKAFVVP